MKQDPENTAMAKAWQMAAEDLGIEFISPFSLKPNAEKEYWIAGFLPHFGSKKGTVIISRFDIMEEDDKDVDQIVENEGYYFSGLNPIYYEKYDRENFMTTLNDWGWFGSMQEKPTWFTGGIGRHGGA